MRWPSLLCYWAAIPRGAVIGDQATSDESIAVAVVRVTPLSAAAANRITMNSGRHDAKAMLKLRDNGSLTDLGAYWGRGESVIVLESYQE